VRPAEVSGLLSLADILIIPPTASGLNQMGNTVLPMKTFRYLNLGKPIIAPDLPDVREILCHRRNAVLVRPDDMNDLMEKFAGLLNDEALQAALARQARQDSLLYTWPARASKISSFIEDRLEDYAS
jgi:glycosyltransferase involved in cell wall biosynthesis